MSLLFSRGAVHTRTCVGRFRRALDNDNLLAARAGAIELKHVGLAEALELTLLILAKEPRRFRAAALRWHARYCGDNKVSIEEATAVLGLLAVLEGRRARLMLLPASWTAVRSCRRPRF